MMRYQIVGVVATTGRGSFIANVPEVYYISWDYIYNQMNEFFSRCAGQVRMVANILPPFSPISFQTMRSFLIKTLGTNSFWKKDQQWNRSCRRLKIPPILALSTIASREYPDPYLSIKRIGWWLSHLSAILSEKIKEISLCRHIRVWWLCFGLHTG